RDALCGRRRSTSLPRTGNDHAILEPYGMFRTEDGEVALAPSQERSCQRLVDAIGAPELRGDPRFRTNDLRVANRAAINAAVEARLITGTAQYWTEEIARLREAGVVLRAPAVTPTLSPGGPGRGEGVL